MAVSVGGGGFQGGWKFDLTLISVILPRVSGRWGELLSLKTIRALQIYFDAGPFERRWSAPGFAG